MRPTIRVVGFDVIERNVARMAASLNHKAVEAALIKNVAAVADRARDYAPKVSGKLAESITVSSNSSEDAGPLEGATAVVFVGPSDDIEYALPVEIGTPPGVTGPGQVFENTAPNPYLRPAFDEEARSALRGVAADLARTVLDAGKG